MNSFIAIDVETANYSPSSICAIGAVKVVDGVIVDSRYSLVNPEPGGYHWACTKVHGLSDKDTWNAPAFGTVWQLWQSWMGDLPMVAHNAQFDQNCIAEACRIYRFDPPAPFYCTLRAARKQIPRGVISSKSLDSLCEFFGIELKTHHCAIDDAMACAKIAMILL